MREWSWHTNADSSELYAGLGIAETNFIGINECSDTVQSRDTENHVRFEVPTG